MPDQVCILMATWNGADHLQAQLDSFAAQDHPDWRLIAADDGSGDATLSILQEFAARSPQGVTLTRGPGRGSTANFIALLADAPDCDWIALADQDDVQQRRPGYHCAEGTMGTGDPSPADPEPARSERDQ